MGLRGELEGLPQFQSNVDDGTGWLNTPTRRSARSRTSLQRVRELLVQGGNDTADPTRGTAIATRSTS